MNTHLFAFVESDGGRVAAGFKGRTGDCVTRAIAIATGTEYIEVYNALNDMAQYERPRKPNKRSNSRTGVRRSTYDRYLTALGWIWVPTMHIGFGCKAHLRPDELPTERLVVVLSRHLTTTYNGVVYDVADPSRGGRRCVYGYWKKGPKSN